MKTGLFCGASAVGAWIVCVCGFAWSLPVSGAEAFAPLFPFVISYDGPDNASSVAHLLDAPAGKHGFVRVENGRFVNGAGAVRLHATNITGPANFPPHETADKLAARLARFGINCVRLHFMDTMYANFMPGELPGILANDPATQRNFDPVQVEKLDYMIAAFKKRGIYVDMNLHVGRTWDERDGFTGKDKRPWADKGLDNFEPRMIELQKEYAKKLMTHVNPYTGLAYTDEPCVAVVEINNENALFNQYHGGAIDRLPEPYASEFRRQWNVWLAKKYATTDALVQAWKWVATPLRDEQIPEGSFAQPIRVDGKKWIFQLSSAEATCGVSNGVLRIDVTRDGDEFFPKLFRTLSVKNDQPYTLSFKIRRTRGAGNATLGLAVADTKDGWRSLGVLQQITVGSAWKSITCPFLAADDCAAAKLYLTRFKKGTYEIDDLSFQSGAKSDFDVAGRIEEGTVPTLGANGYAPRQVVRDFTQFLVDTEHAYWVGIYDYLKKELKVKSVVSGTQLGYSPPYVQAELDYIDNHSYWCHPSGKDLLHSQKDWKIRNESMVNSLACIQGLAAQRILGKPYTVSEYGHPFPNQYGAEGQPMLRAYGAFQGWDGVFEYSYNHYPAEYEPQGHPWCYFDMVARTDILAHLPACAAIFLRCDVREAITTVVGTTDYAAYFNRLSTSKSVEVGIGALGFDARQTLLHKTAVDLSGKQGSTPASGEKISGTQKVFVSDTGELTWNREEPGAGYWTVNTANTKLFTGFPKGRTVALGGVTLAVGPTRLGWATVSLVSRHATGFGESGRAASILLAATGVAENKGQEVLPLSKDEITLSDWGKGPVCTEGIPATLVLPSVPSKTTCFALDPSGNRKRPIPVAEAEGGGSKIVVGPEFETVWYEIEIR